MTGKRFIFHSTEIEDTLETNEEYKYTSCDEDGFQDLCEMLNELHEKNLILVRKNGAMEVEIECLSEENEQCKMMIATLRNIILENGIDIND